MKWLVLGLLALSINSGWAQQSPTPSGTLARALNDSFAAVYEKVAPAVVVIEVRSAGVQGLPQGLNFFLRTPDGSVVPGQGEVDQGSGFLISPDGYIVTNNHVVEAAKGGSITVKLKDGRKFKAELVGQDDKSDVAVLKIKAENLPVAQLADSDGVKVGQFAFAIGAPFDLPYTFTVGVVSAVGRTEVVPGNANYEEYIQTDASINPGNSGGPLCDIDGRVVGVNTLISGMNRGLGFAVPINIVKNVADQLIATGRVARPWLGISIVGLQDNEQAQRYFPGIESGVLVSGIEPGTPAFSSDLRAGDVILKVDGVAVARAHELQREILSKKIGQTVKLDVSRNGKDIAVSLQTGEQPSQMIRTSNRLQQMQPQQPYRDPQMRRYVPPRDVQPERGEDPENVQGLVLTDAPQDSGVPGAAVADVLEDSAASAAGLMQGDIITEVAGKPVRSAEEFESALQQADLSRGVMLMVDRRGQKTFAILKP